MTTLTRPTTTAQLRQLVALAVERAEVPPLTTGHYRVDETDYFVAYAASRARLRIHRASTGTLLATVPVTGGRPCWVDAGPATQAAIGELLANPAVARAAYCLARPTACWCCGKDARHLDATGRADRCAKGTCTCATRAGGRRRGRRGRR